MDKILFLIIVFLSFNTDVFSMGRSNKKNLELSFKDIQAKELEKKIDGISFFASIGISALPKLYFNKEQKYVTEVSRKVDRKGFKLFQEELKEKIKRRAGIYANLCLSVGNNNDIKEKIEGISFLSVAGIKKASKRTFTKEQKYFVNCKYAELNRCWLGELPLELQEKIIESLIPAKITPDGLIEVLKDLAYVRATNKQFRDLMCAELKKYSFFKLPEYGLNAQSHFMQQVMKKIFLSLDSDTALSEGIHFVKKNKKLKNTLFALFKTDFKSVYSLIEQYKTVRMQKELFQKYVDHADTGYENQLKKYNESIKKTLEALFRFVSPNILIGYETLLERALKDNDYEMLDFLLSKDADINFLKTVIQFDLVPNENFSSLENNFSEYEITILNVAVRDNPKFALELLKKDTINPRLGVYRIDLEIYKNNIVLYKKIFNRLIKKGLNPETRFEVLDGLVPLSLLHSKAFVDVDNQRYRELAYGS